MYLIMVSLCMNFITLQSDGKLFVDDRDYVAFIQTVTATLSLCETHEHVNEILTVRILFRVLMHALFEYTALMQMQTWLA